MALLVPKGKRNRENKLYLNSKTIIRLLDQFLKGENDVNSTFTMVYGDFGWFEADRNKAKQSQSYEKAKVIRQKAT